MTSAARIAAIPGDGIGKDVCVAGLEVCQAALDRVGAPALVVHEINAGARYYSETGRDIEENGESRAGEADAIFLGAIGWPSVRAKDGTEISPHLRLREVFQLYAGVRPVKAYPNAPQRLADPRAETIDLVILRESTEGLFYSAAVHGRSKIIEDTQVCDTLRISRPVTERLHRFAFRLAQKRQALGRGGSVTCVDKANVFASMAFFRKIFDEIRPEFDDVPASYNYVDAQALDLIRRPWDFDVLVMENMFGDILSDLAGGIVGGMGLAACGEYGDEHALFQPAHGSAPDIAGQDKANPLAAILSAAMMLDYLGERMDEPIYIEAGQLIEAAVDSGFTQNRLRPKEFGGDMGTVAVTTTVAELTTEVAL